MPQRAFTTLYVEKSSSQNPQEQNIRNSLKKKLNYFYYFGKNLTFYLFAISSRLSYNQTTETTYCDYTYPAKQNDDNDKRGNYFSYHLSQ